MPDYHAILSLYQVIVAATVTGAMEAEADHVAAKARDRVALDFLSGSERTGWAALPEQARSARLRLGRQRLHRWEMANPDIVAVLRRKARGAALH